MGNPKLSHGRGANIAVLLPPLEDIGRLLQLFLSLFVNGTSIFFLKVVVRSIINSNVSICIILYLVHGKGSEVLLRSVIGYRIVLLCFFIHFNGII
jgi:hypothetical protein